MRQISVIVLCASLSLNPLAGLAWAADIMAPTVDSQGTLAAPQKLVKAPVVPPHQDPVKKSQATQTRWFWPLVAGIGTVVAVVGGLAVWFFSQKSTPSTSPLSDNPGLDNSKLLDKMRARLSELNAKYQTMDSDLKIIQQVAINPVQNLETLTTIKGGGLTLKDYEFLGEIFASQTHEELKAQLLNLQPYAIQYIQSTVALLPSIKATLTSFVERADTTSDPISWGMLIKEALEKKKSTPAPSESLITS